MKRSRKMISLIMLVVMLATLTPFQALAADIPTNGTDETITTVTEPQNEGQEGQKGQEDQTGQGTEDQGTGSDEGKGTDASGDNTQNSTDAGDQTPSGNEGTDSQTVGQDPVNNGDENTKADGQNSTDPTATDPNTTDPSATGSDPVEKGGNRAVAAEDLTITAKTTADEYAYKDEVTLSATAESENADFNPENVTWQWQKRNENADDESAWTDIDGANESFYSFIYDETNRDQVYRAVATYEEVKKASDTVTITPKHSDEYVLDVSKIATTNGFNQDIDLLNEVTVTPDTYMDGDEEKPVLIRVASATPHNTSSGFDSSGDYDPETSTLNVKDEDSQGHKRAQVTYTVVYEAYVEGTDTVLATESVDILFFDDSRIGPRVDEDVAYISKVEIDETIDGMASFDSEAGPGYDTGANNKTVRTFDTVTTTVSITNAVYPDSDYAKYKDGYVGFEFVLEGTKDQVEFAESYMSWLQAKNAEYKFLEVEKDGKKYQVMRGRFLWESAEEGQPAIGAANLSIDVAYTVLAMKNGDEIQPDFTFWMEHNDVPQKDTAIDDFTAENYEFVKGYTDACETHDRVEPVHIRGDKVQVSAAPWYNVKLTLSSDSTTQALGYYDLSTGKYSVNKETSTSINGRSFLLGVGLEVRRDDGKGLKGCEFPNGDDITLSLDFTELSFRGDSGATYDASSYAPVLWSYEGNSNASTQADGREIPTGLYRYSEGGGPLNKGNGSNCCYNGGTWQATQNGTTYRITVSGYELSTELSKIPHRNARSETTAYTYYDKSATSAAEVNDLFFSVGEFWFVQPFYDYDITSDSDGNVTSVSKGDYIVDANGEAGTFRYVLKEGGLSITSESGQPVAEAAGPSDNSNQTKTGDDAVSVSIYLARGGSIVSTTGYTEYGAYSFIDAYSPLTAGCGYNGKDWVMAGGKMTISSQLTHRQGDTDYHRVAYDQFLKFDDRFFDLEKVRAAYAKQTYRDYRILYAAKPDKSGWNHAGLDPDEEGYDQEMMETEADDLIYFSSLDELESAGYTCVGVLEEVRGVRSASEDFCFLSLDGTAINDTSNCNHVFMETIESHAWYKKDVNAAIRAYYGADEITDAQYLEYMMEEFPSKLDSGEGTCLKYENYPKASWDKQYSNTDGLRTYDKVSYNPDGTTTGTTGNLYGDSCLVIGYLTGISIDCAQKTSGGDEKIVYDMDTAQRVVDYVVHPTISAVSRQAGSGSGDSTYTTQLTIETTLPAKLTYIDNSSYLGGTYTQTREGRQGTVDGGTLLDTVVTHNDDGTTTLKWVYETTLDWSEVEGDTALLDPIYFSCDIGEVGSDDDVVNNEQLTVTTDIESTEDNLRDKNITNGNKAEQTIQISKGAAVSLADSAKQIAVDTGDDVAFTSKVVNDSKNAKVNAATIVHVPTNGYSNTKYHGDRIVKEFTVPSEGYTVWYTTDPGSFDRDDYSAGEVTASGSGWTQLTVGADGTVELPADTTGITAFAVIGDIPANGSLDIETVINAPNDQAGDFFQHWVSLDGLTNYARSYVVKRSIRGLAWVDKNADGLQASTELPDSTVAPITVTLLKLKDGGDASSIDSYEVFKDKDGNDATIPVGKSLDVLTCELTDMPGYQYDFTNMPEGTYAVRFNNADETIASRYRVTEKDVNNDANDDIDSDAAYADSKQSTSEWGIVDGSYIAGIVLPATETITTSHYVTRYHDLGITVMTYDLEIGKTVEELTGSTTDPDPDKEFSFTVKVKKVSDSASAAYAGKYTLIKADGSKESGKITTSGEIVLKAGERALIEDLEIDTQYEINETAPTAADGFIYDTTAVTGTLTSDLVDDDAIIKNNQYKTVEVPVTKTWSGYDGSDSFTATVTLTAKVGSSSYALPEGYEATHTFTSPDEGTYTFTDLPAKTPAGADITYSVSETGVTSESVTVSNKSGTYYVYSKTETPHVEGGPSYKLLGKWVPSEETGSDGTAIVNEWTPSTDQEEGTTGFDIRKVDDHGELITSKQATFKVEKKTADGKELVGEYTTIDGVATVADLLDGEYIITESQAPEGFLANGASFELEITKELKLKEIKETGLINIFKRFFSFLAGTNRSPYTWDGESFELTVKNREATEATVKKVWHDGEDQFHKRPETLGFSLYQKSGSGSKEAVKDAAGNAVTATLPVDNKWEATVTDLPKYDAQGNEIEYTWEESEDGLPGCYELTNTATEGTVTTFTNTLKTQITVNKVWEGQDNESLIPASITVTLFSNGTEKATADLTKSNEWTYTFGATADDVLYAYDEQGNTITYTVTEAEVQGYKGEISDPETDADGNVTFTATNAYSATGKLKLGGLKKLDVETGKIVAGQFKFTVKDGDKTIATGTNDKDGNIIFDPAEITYSYDATADEPKDDRGEHTLVISETKVEGRVNGAATDAEDVTVKVNVTDKGDGTLTVKPEDITESVEMTNSYEATGDITFSGKKSIAHGRRIEDGEVFTFTVKEGDETVATGTSDADGNIEFTKIEYTLNKDTDDTGTHTYTVTEDTYEKKNGVTNSEQSYTVTVEVRDKGNGELEVTPSEEFSGLDFENPYEAKGDISVPAAKVLENRAFKEGDEWTFTIEAKDGAPLPVDEDGNEVTTVTLKPAEGNEAKIDLGTFKYDLSDLGNKAYESKTFTYTITESGEIQGVKNDADTDRELKIKVTDDGSGELRAELADDSEEVKFTNTYNPPEKHHKRGSSTGDSANGALWALMLLLAGGALGGIVWYRRRKKV